MINSLIQYELEIAVRDQTQLQRRAYLWRVVKQASTDSNARGTPTLLGPLTRLLRVRTASVPAGRRQGLTTAQQEDGYRTEEAASGGALLQIADPRGGFDRGDHLFGDTLKAEELARYCPIRVHRCRAVVTSTNRHCGASPES